MSGWQYLVRCQGGSTWYGVGVAVLGAVSGRQYLVSALGVSTSGVTGGSTVEHNFVSGWWYETLDHIWAAWEPANGCSESELATHWPTSLDGTQDLYCWGKRCGGSPVIRCAWDGQCGYVAYVLLFPSADDC